MSSSINYLLKHEYDSLERKDPDIEQRKLDTALHLLSRCSSSQRVDEDVAIAIGLLALSHLQQFPTWPDDIFECVSSPWDRIDNQYRKLILVQILSRLPFASASGPSISWYIEAAVSDQEWAMIHLLFIESALRSSSETMRVVAAWALAEIPVTYWRCLGDMQHRSELVAIARRDPVKRVSFAVQNL